MSEVRGVQERLVAATGEAKVPFMIAGSFASTAHGLPRTTQDLDVVIDPPDSLALDSPDGHAVERRVYVDADTAKEALRHRTMFNAIDRSAWKIGFTLRKARLFSIEEFRRRTTIEILGVPVFVASAEDTVIAKLE